MGATAGTYKIKCCAVVAQKAEDSTDRGYHVVSYAAGKSVHIDC